MTNKAAKKETAPVEVTTAETPEAPVATPTAAAPVAKSKFPKVLLIILAVIGGLVILGFLLSVGTSVFVGSQILKNIGWSTKDGGKTVTLGGGNDTVTVSQKQVWPATMPAAVPKFTKGDITATSRFGDLWSVQVSNVSKADVDAYKATLVSQGYTIDGEVNYNETLSWGATKGVYTINAVYAGDEKNLMLTADIQKPIE